jgi:cell wall-associated NlpC family hydrolase
MPTREEIVAEARSWIGTPYLHQARVKGVGVDCAGLLIGCCKNLGLLSQDFDVRGYPRSPDGMSMMALCDEYMTRISTDTMQLGDALLIRWGQDPQHLGLLGNYIYGGLSIIHALGTPDAKGRVIEHRLDKSTRGRMVAAYRLPGVA